VADALDDDPDLERLLEHLRAARAFDFTGYKRHSLSRRIRRRMQDIGIPDFATYQDFLQVHPEEFAELFNTILINVTGFFRDASAWEALRTKALPALLGARGDDDPIRVWSAGCATGQEAYSVVMLFAGVLGPEETKRRVKVYATDVDEEVLDYARRAVYTEREMGGLPEGLAERWFTRTDGGWAFDNELRRCVIFGRHDLIQDAPISRVDLLLCRNALMYLNAEAQARVVVRLHYALAEAGVLVLGKVEMLLGRNELFRTIDLRHRIFAKVPRPTMRSQLLALAEDAIVVPDDVLPSAVPVDRVLESVFEDNPEAQVVIDARGVLVLANRSARALFTLDPDDVGRLFHDLEMSYRPVDLRSAIDAAVRDRETVSLREVERWLPSAEPAYLDIQVKPLTVRGVPAGVVLAFQDVTRYRLLRDEVDQTHHALETAYAQLQSANEELETTNEELQSTIEELETTNEELQSTNEELETMNEELHSTNAELQAINDEVRERTTQLDDVNAFLESILTSLRGGVAVVDRELRVRVWNEQAFDLWGLRPEEAEGRNLLGLDIGLPLDGVVGQLRGCLDGEPTAESRVVTAVNRRGQTIECRLECGPLRSADGSIDGVIVLMSEERAAAT
jgi:two-component system CheB/CheR fusion protein